MLSRTTSESAAASETRRASSFRRHRGLCSSVRAPCPIQSNAPSGSEFAASWPRRRVRAHRGNRLHAGTAVKSPGAGAGRTSAVIGAFFLAANGRSPAA
jgi:hypothetical protein